MIATDPRVIHNLRGKTISRALAFSSDSSDDRPVVVFVFDDGEVFAVQGTQLDYAMVDVNLSPT